MKLSKVREYLQPKWKILNKVIGWKNIKKKEKNLRARFLGPQAKHAAPRQVHVCKRLYF
jgi:hypothetical protein